MKTLFKLYPILFICICSIFLSSCTTPKDKFSQDESQKQYSLDENIDNIIKILKNTKDAEKSTANINDLISLYGDKDEINEYYYTIKQNYSLIMDQLSDQEDLKLEVDNTLKCLEELNKLSNAIQNTDALNIQTLSYVNNSQVHNQKYNLINLYRFERLDDVFESIDYDSLNKLFNDDAIYEEPQTRQNDIKIAFKNNTLIVVCGEYSNSFDKIVKTFN